MKKEIFTWILAMFLELLKVSVIVLVVIAIVLAFQQAFAPLSFQCATCENRAKIEQGNELYLEQGIITEVYVKSGQGCFIPDGTCYVITSGGVGYNYVIVEKVGDGPNCQDISHLEVCYEVDPATETPVSTNTETPDPSETFTQTPESTATLTQTPTDTPEDPSETPTSTATPENTPTITLTPTDVPERTPNGNGCG